MAWSDYWGALGTRQRAGLLAASAVIIAVAAYAATRLLDDPYTTLEAHLTPERLGEVSQQLDRAKLEYRVGDDGTTLTVPASELGKARAAAAAGPSTAPASVGLELFKETDFSSTDFAQRINYQRALQGELERTLQTVNGVRSVRVHVILADPGLFKSDSTKASAAVSVSMQPGRDLTRAQVRGIQRLVTASVPELKIDDVVVLDESGSSLTQASTGLAGEASSGQLEMKREADQYLEGKLARLLQDVVPQGVVSLSVDAELDARQSRVTTEEPLAVAGPKDQEHPAGVLVKEHQSQHTRATGTAPASTDAPDADTAEWDNEYKVGQRMEQVLSAPGSMRKLSVAVVLQGAPATLGAAQVEQLVANAVGIDRSRGDSVDVLLLPAPAASGVPHPALLAMAMPMQRDSGAARDPAMAAPATQASVIQTLAVLLLGVAIIAVITLGWSGSRRRLRDREAVAAEPDVDATVAKVRQWLSEGRAHVRG